MPPPTALKAGDRVAVLWGLDTRRGEVRAVYHTGDVERVLVELDADENGLDEPQTVVLAADAVKPLAEEPDLPPPGSWLVGLRYERDIGQALSRVLRDWQPTIRTNVEDSGREIDLLVESSHGVLVVEVKVVHDLLPDRIFDRAIQQLRRTLDILPNAKGLIATSAALPTSVTRRIGLDGMLSSDLAAVQWRGSRDDKQLRRVVRALLNDKPDDIRASEA
jgi:hypothetical protein